MTQTFRELVSSYSSGIRRLCAIYARNPADREDLFQDIFLAIWKALPAFRHDASERIFGNPPRSYFGADASPARIQSLADLSGGMDVRAQHLLQLSMARAILPSVLTR